MSEQQKIPHDPAYELLDFTDDMLARLDRDFRILAANQAYAQMFGQSREQLRGRTVAQVFAHDPEHYRTAVEPLLEGCLRGETGRFEHWVAVPGFGNLFLDIRYQPVRDTSGAIIGIAVSGRNRTEVMQSINALERSEALLKRTEHIANLGGWSYDIRNNSIQWTDEMYEIHEVPHDFIVTTEQLNGFILPEFLDEVLANLARTLAGEPTEVLSQMATAKGNRKWVRSIAFPVFENGRVVRVEGILQDLTELTTVQRQLQQSEEKYRALVEDSNVMVWESDVPPAPPGFKYMSPRAETLTGYSQAELLSPDFFVRHVHPDDLQPSFEKVLAMTAARQDFSLEYRLYRADGSLMWVHDEIKIVNDERGTPLMLRGVMIDITQIKEMQAGLAKALRAIEHHKHILDQHAIVSITDRDGLITHVNDKFLEVSGYDRSYFIGKSHSILRSGLHPPAFFSELWETILAGRVWQGEICNRNREGGLYWLHTTIVPLLDEAGNAEEFMSVRTDITEMKRNEETLRRAHKMEAIGQLTGGIAHDFNNLLGIVIGNLELIESAVVPEPALLQQLENARNAALRGSVLTRRLLNFSQQTPVAGKALDLNRIIRGLEVLISKSLTALVKVDMHLSPELWQVEVEAGDFEDALINLALNASDAMPQGGRLSFTTHNVALEYPEFRGTTLVPPGEYVEIVVADTGVGMSQDIMDKIFDPYFTTKPSDKGSGLGLAMVYGFAKRSQGNVFVESSPGAGARFTLLLPRSASDEAPIANKQTAPEATVRGSQHETILVVDDEVEILKIARANLERLGYRVLCCGNGDEALQVLKSQEPIDLLFTDIVMPGTLNGFELGEAALKLRPALKLLFTTGYAKVETTLARDHWREALIQKPYRGSDLARRIRELLDAAM